MRFAVIINNEEAVANGDEQTAEDCEYEIGELLRSGYYEVERLKVIPEYICGTALREAINDSQTG